MGSNPAEDAKFFQKPLKALKVALLAVFAVSAGSFLNPGFSPSKTVWNIRDFVFHGVVRLRSIRRLTIIETIFKTKMNVRNDDTHIYLWFGEIYRTGSYHPDELFNQRLYDFSDVDNVIILRRIVCCVVLGVNDTLRLQLADIDFLTDQRSLGLFKIRSGVIMKQRQP